VVEDQLAIFGGPAARQRPIPTWPVFDQAEEKALIEVLRSGQWWSGNLSYHAAADGECLSRAMAFERAFADFHGAKYALACASGTAALELALKAAGIGPGDEVIVPPYSFLATASAPLLIGAIPVFCDIEPETFNLDPVRLEEAITPRTKAVIPVHFAGLPADMDRILAVARKNDLFVLEDAAHGHGGSSRGRALGTLGDAGIFSFQASKNMTAGEGGLILTDRPEIAELSNSYLWAGRNAGRPWYEHFRLGWNYRITEFQAAILIEQLKRLPAQAERRMGNGLRLTQGLRRIPGIRPLSIPDWVTRHAFHLFIFRFDAAAFGVSREQFLEWLTAEGVPCSSGYSQPLYRNPLFAENQFHGNGQPLTPPGRHIDYLAYAEKCPVAERACAEAVWIEHRVLLGEPEEMDEIVHAIEKIHAYAQRQRR
jgi:dTDP-4-amino-4,6-dideoxygalactose transaminase